jgi:hypothetical protein
MSTKLASDLAALMDRDLGRLQAELEAYPNDGSVWRVGGTTKNSAGTLTLHLVGNLEAYVGAVFAGTGYVRDRDREFSERDVSRAELLERVARCRQNVSKGLSAITDEAMLDAYPGEMPGPFQGWSTHRVLTHLSSHFLWHLGQIDYHRRLLVENAGG